jgi:hypothetical protein
VVPTAVDAGQAGKETVLTASSASTGHQSTWGAGLLLLGGLLLFGGVLKARLRRGQHSV